MFRKENGVTLVALVITIIVLLILAGVTISMVLGDDGIISQASGANTAQNKANVTDQASVAYATVRTEDIARKAGVSTSTYKEEDVVYVTGMAAELAKSGAFTSVKVSGDDIEVATKGTKGTQYFTITVTEPTTEASAKFEISDASDTEVLTEETALTKAATY